MTQLRELLEAKKFSRIPLRKLQSGHYCLTAKVNGISGTFILDTGASTSCIGFHSIPQFKLDTEDSEIKAAGAGAVNMETRLTRGNTLSMGNKLLKNTSFILFDLSHVNEALSQVEETPVQGILGADLLKTLRAVIDYGRNALYIH